MTKRLIITVSHVNQTDQENAATYFIPMINAYCKIHNISFEHTIVKNNPEDRHISWVKIPILHKYIELYDEILFISNNSTILNQTTNVFEFIKSAAPEEKKWNRNVSIEPVLYTLSDKSTNGHPLSNIFLLNCTNKQLAKDLLNDWWNHTTQHCKSNHPFEQQVLIEWKKDSKKASQIRVADAWSIQEFDKDQVFITITPAYKNIQLSEAKRLMYRMLNKKTKKIGLYVRQANYYASGAGQNCIFIKHSLEAAGFHVDLLIDYDPSKPTIVDSQIPYIYKSDKDVDYTQYSIIVFGSYIPLKTKIQQIKDKGVKTVIFHPMNSFDGIQNDHFIHNVETSIPMFEEQFNKIADEIWMVHNHERTYKSLLEIQNDHKIPVRVIPLTWSPLFTLYNGIQYKYKHPSKNVMDIIIMEPNSSYCKNAWLPLLIAESFYMKYKEKLNKVYIFGSLSGQANKMINNLSISKDSKLRKIGRMPVNEIIKFFCSSENKVAVLSHNIQIPRNYAYYDVMNADIPFLHNSLELGRLGIGYLYTNVQEGLVQLENVLNSHNSASYTTQIQKELQLINPYNENVVNVFENLVENKHQDVEVSVISTGNAERLQFMKKQFTDISFPYKYSIFNAYTPEHSTDYFDDSVKDQWKGGFSDHKLKMYQCGIRSHVDALYNCINNSSAEYFLIIEDDVAFRTDVSIKDEIKRYITLMGENPDIHYISLVYRPLSSLDNCALIDTALHRLPNNENDLYWGFNKKDTPLVWGAQAYLISRYYANKFVNMLKTKKGSELQTAVQHYDKTSRTYSLKAPQLIIDSVMPIFLNQALAYPMLGVERYFSHSISSNLEFDRLTSKYIEHVKIPYYGMV
jgi:GR25 family glycosyltransferase involved in LPS biosynthesis